MQRVTCIEFKGGSGVVRVPADRWKETFLKIRTALQPGEQHTILLVTAVGSVEMRFYGRGKPVAYGSHLVRMDGRQRTYSVAKPGGGCLLGGPGLNQVSACETLQILQSLADERSHRSYELCFPDVENPSEGRVILSTNGLDLFVYGGDLPELPSRVPAQYASDLLMNLPWVLTRVFYCNRSPFSNTIRARFVFPAKTPDF